MSQGNTPLSYSTSPSTKKDRHHTEPTATLSHKQTGTFFGVSSSRKLFTPTERVCFELTTGCSRWCFRESRPYLQPLLLLEQTHSLTAPCLVRFGLPMLERCLNTRLTCHAGCAFRIYFQATQTIKLIVVSFFIPFH
ncbi:uncharacterized protein YALI1_A16826g [Yarrowia lipolytica]|uniref:Uncharacterized protein n=1 Tax=Yarrowia lipolytica TaxID=4952 RepID=A0A1D8N526_YARLL|nr:hypothetical protein YALI1_A16826g [Yarrowia lipolytica]